jgi:hypothetical protein
MDVIILVLDQYFICILSASVMCVENVQNYRVWLEPVRKNGLRNTSL